MTPTRPDHIRLYVEDDVTASPVAPISAGLIERCCSAFTAATGWNLAHFAPGTPVPHMTEWNHALAGPGREDVATLALLQNDTDRRVSPTLATDLASSVAALLDEVFRTRTQLWQREAHLAAAIPLVVRPQDEDRQLAERLEAVLKCGAEAVQCSAAALYLLDDDTRHLKLRSQWGLSDECFLDPPRRLRGSKADLEALTGHAVVLEQPDRVETWGAPQHAATAICVPVATANVPLGTLWIFGNEPRGFRDAEINLVEVIAGRLAVELEREILVREQALACRDRESIDASVWQQSLWRSALPPLEGWHFAAAPRCDEGVHGDTLSSFLNEDHRLSFALGSADRDGLLGSLAAANFCAAADACRTIVSPARRLARINETAARMSSGDQQLAAATGLLHTKTGELQLVTAGSATAFVVRPHGWEQLTMKETYAAVGSEPQASYRTVKTQLDPTDVLLVLAGPLRESDDDLPRVDGQHLAEALLHHHHLKSDQMLEYLTALVTRDATIWHDRPAMLLVGREE